MKIIYEDCKDVEYIKCSTNKVKSIKDLNIKVNIKNNEILRSRYYKNGNCYFNFNMGLCINSKISKEVEYMKTIEMFYPNMFSWKFDGNHIEAVGIIPVTNNNLGIINRYKGIYGFIKILRTRLLTILKYRDFVNIVHTKIVDDEIFALGSINNKYGRYVVNILPTDNEIKICMASKNRKVTNIKIKTLNMKFWVHEINPDFYKERVELKVKKYPIENYVIKEYPPCIKTISKEKRKGNYKRFLLATFLLSIHNERDAKHQLDIMLNDEERNHLNTGNCKDQWRTILAKKYSAPSCKTMIECGACIKGCKRPHPSILNIKQEKKNDK